MHTKNHLINARPGAVSLSSSGGEGRGEEVNYLNLNRISEAACNVAELPSGPSALTGQARPTARLSPGPRKLAPIKRVSHRATPAPAKVPITTWHGGYWRKKIVKAAPGSLAPAKARILRNKPL